MTTQQPTSEQVVRWASEAGMLPISFNRTSMSTEMSAFTPELEAFVKLARADPEATVKEQAAEIERLNRAVKIANELLDLEGPEDTEALIDELSQQLAEARLRKDEAWNKAAECVNGHSQTLEKLAAAQLHIEKLREALEVVAIAPLVNDYGLPKYGISVSEMKLVQATLSALYTQPNLSTLEAERQRVAAAKGEK